MFLFRKIGFTLAEVLITLGIIGVVASMTIPTMLQNMQTQQTVSALKKAYSELSQAYTQAVQENGTPDNWGITDLNTGADTKKFLDILLQYMRVTKNCGVVANSGCFPVGTYTQLVGGGAYDIDGTTTRSKAILADGTLIVLWPNVAMLKTPDCSGFYGSAPVLQGLCTSVLVDVNGFKKPNVYGQDTFFFYITKNGIVPQGTAQEPAGAYNFSTYCKTSNTGQGCTAWALYNENQDYLKCSGLDWNGPIKCP